MRTIACGIIVLCVALSMASDRADARDRNPKKTAPSISLGTPAVTLMNINDITSWVESDGLFEPMVSSSWNGEFPILSGTGVVFQEGILFGGKVNDGSAPVVRINGTTYPTSMQPGKILTSGGGIVTGAEDPGSPDVRIWRVRPDVRPYFSSVPDLRIDAATYFHTSVSQVTQSQLDQIRIQYFSDWQEWPASKGAPWYIDTIGTVRNDAGYDPSNPHHIPGIPGADQTIWFVCNDLNINLTHSLYGAPPIGIEEQMTLWGYQTGSTMDRMIFKDVKLIYKGTPTTPANATIDSFFVAQFADGDVGDAGNDYAGCDSSMNLGYEYNADPVDARYAFGGSVPPAVGYAFLEGSAHYTGSSSDSALVNFSWRHGYASWHTSPMTTFDYFAAGSPVSDPDFNSINGSYEWFNLMRGDIPLPVWPAGVPFYQSSTYAASHSIRSNYALSGDPVTHSGWVDGYDMTAGDRRIACVHGPTQLKLGDTAEVVIVMAAAEGVSNLSSVFEMKNELQQARRLVDQSGPVASVSPTQKIYSINSTAQFSGHAAVLGGSVQSTGWFLAGKPSGSSAALVVNSSRSSEIQLDVPGNYSVGFFATSNGQSDTAYAYISATTNRPPAVSFSVSPNPITIGDTLHLDGSATSDPDGDSLAYEWSVEGDFSGIDWSSLPFDSTHSPLLGSHSTIAQYVPLRSCRIVISLAVQDSFFSRQMVDSIMVQPIATTTVAVTKIYTTSMNPLPTNSTVPFYYNGTFTRASDNSIWVQALGAYYPLKLSDINHPSQIYAPNYPGVGRNFAVGHNVLAVCSGYPGVYVYSLNGSNGITSTAIANPFYAANHTMSDSTSSAALIEGTTLFASFGTPGIYAYDVSNPANPSQVGHTSNGRCWTAMVMDGNHIFGVSPATSELLYADITNPGSMTAGAASINGAYSGIRKAGQYFCLFNNDTAAIYDLSTPATPVLLSMLEIPKTINLENSIHDVSCDGKVLMLGTAEGTYFYNVTDPTSPQPLGKFIIGYNVMSVFVSGDTVLSYNSGRTYVGYDAMNVYSLDRSSGVDVTTTTPAKFGLCQNYPNPFNPTTVISFELTVDSRVTLRVYDILGRLVATLVDGKEAAGEHAVTFNAAGLPSGVYFYRISAMPPSGKDRTMTETKKLMILK